MIEFFSSEFFRTISPFIVLLFIVLIFSETARRRGPSYIVIEDCSEKSGYQIVNDLDGSANRMVIVDRKKYGEWLKSVHNVWY